jgi:hypothetical protein
MAGAAGAAVKYRQVAPKGRMVVLLSSVLGVVLVEKAVLVL